jgi:hypothetical protein
MKGTRHSEEQIIAILSLLTFRIIVQGASMISTACLVSGSTVWKAQNALIAY